LVAVFVGEFGTALGAWGQTAHVVSRLNGLPKARFVAPVIYRGPTFMALG